METFGSSVFFFLQLIHWIIAKWARYEKILLNFSKIMEKARFRHVLDLSKEEKRAFLESFDMVMSDCDGRSKVHHLKVR